MAKHMCRLSYVACCFMSTKAGELLLPWLSNLGNLQGFNRRKLSESWVSDHRLGTLTVAILFSLQNVGQGELSLITTLPVTRVTSLLSPWIVLCFMPSDQLCSNRYWKQGWDDVQFQSTADDRHVMVVGCYAEICISACVCSSPDQQSGRRKTCICHKLSFGR
jgi:hypothetical protein